MSLPSTVTSHLPPHLPPEVLATGVILSGSLESAFGETVVLWLDGAPAVFSREDSFSPFNKAALAKQDPVALEEEGISRVFRVRLAGGDEATLEPGYFEASDLKRLLSGTARGTITTSGYSSSSYSSGDYSSSSYGSGDYSSSYGSSSYSSSDYGTGASPYLFSSSIGDVTDEADEADDNAVSSTVTSHAVKRASVASSAVTSTSVTSTAVNRSASVSSAAVKSAAVSTSAVTSAPVTTTSVSTPSQAATYRADVSKAPLFDNSPQDLFGDLSSPYADRYDAQSPYADRGNADSPYDHDHDRRDYDHEAAPYADKDNADSPYDLDQAQHQFDVDEKQHRFDIDEKQHRFDVDEKQHRFDVDEKQHRFDVDEKQHRFDADPVASRYDPDGAPPQQALSAFEIDDEVRRVIREEGRFSAIQRYRKLTGAGLNEARSAVDNLVRPMSRPQVMGTSSAAASTSNSKAMRFIWFMVGLSFLGWLMENC